jgi:leucine dehydrogenase
VQIHELKTATGHERVGEGIDRDAGDHGIIAVHSTRLGPAVGGTRLLPYDSVDDALADVLKLSRAMSYKAAVAGLAFGGGKAVVIGDTAAIDRERVFRAHGRFVEQLGGMFITAEDVGTSPTDMALVSQETRHVAGLKDPSPWTARGVFQAIRAALASRGRNGFEGIHVAVQGCGNVGSCLVRELRDAGATVTASDIDADRLAGAVRAYGAAPVDPESIYDVGADVFAPCGLGGVLDDDTIPRLRVQIVAGAANNQLREPRHAEALRDRDILYVPDYVANAGGIISGAQEISGWSEQRSRDAVEAIYDTVERIIQRARTDGVTPSHAADRAAEDALRA